MEHSPAERATRRHGPHPVSFDVAASSGANVDKQRAEARKRKVESTLRLDEKTGFEGEIAGFLFTSLSETVRLTYRANVRLIVDKQAARGESFAVHFQ